MRHAVRLILAALVATMLLACGSPKTQPTPTPVAPSSTSAPATKAPTKTPASPTKSPKTDPRYATCKEAIAHGFGPYTKGVDREYAWYTDGDRDGIVCERS